jgi:hypothetical protein
MSYSISTSFRLGPARANLTLYARLIGLDLVQVGADITTGFVGGDGGVYGFTYASVPDDFIGYVKFYSAGDVLQTSMLIYRSAEDVTLAAILAACQQWNPSRVSSSAAVIEGGKHLITVRGDAYYAGGPPGRGPATWTLTEGSEPFPDFTGATVVLTSRRISDDVVELTTEGTISGPVDGVVMIAVEFTAEQTANLTPGDKDDPYKTNKFDLQITLDDGTPWTPIRGGEPVGGGGHTIIEDQTRAE